MSITNEGNNLVALHGDGSITEYDITEAGLSTSPYTEGKLILKLQGGSMERIIPSKLTASVYYVLGARNVMKIENGQLTQTLKLDQDAKGFELNESNSEIYLANIVRR